MSDSKEQVDADELKSLFPANVQQNGSAPASDDLEAPRSDETENSQQESTEQLLEKVEADLRSVVNPEYDSDESDEQESTSALHSYQFAEFEEDQVNQTIDFGASIQAIRNVELDVSIELGRAEMLIEDVLKLKQGSVLPLDKLAGDPVDILANGRLVARGEVVVLNENFCVRVCEILNPEF
ncbi:MAG: flagellar motor switch protein FliN [Planctomycetaceae bacterium]|nr:flagellar motor switch protein FliN [Planctomycetaceae bacterium]